MASLRATYSFSNLSRWNALKRHICLLLPLLLGTGVSLLSDLVNLMFGGRQLKRGLITQIYGPISVCEKN